MHLHGAFDRYHSLLSAHCHIMQSGDRHLKVLRQAKQQAGGHDFNLRQSIDGATGTSMQSNFPHCTPTLSLQLIYTTKLLWS